MRRVVQWSCVMARLIQLVSGMTRFQPASAKSEWFLSYISHLLELWFSDESQLPSLPIILLISITPKWSLTPSPFFHDRLRIRLVLPFSFYSLVGYSYFMVLEGQRNTWSGPGSGCKSSWLWCAAVVTFPRRLEQQEFPQREHRIDVSHVIYGNLSLPTLSSFMTSPENWLFKRHGILLNHSVNVLILFPVDNHCLAYFLLLRH